MKPVPIKSTVNPGAKDIPMELVRRLRRHINGLEKGTRNTTTWLNYRDKVLIEMGLYLMLRREELTWVDVADARLDIMPVIGKGSKKRHVPVLVGLRGLLDKFIRDKERRGERIEDQECACGSGDNFCAWPQCPVCLGSGIDAAPLFVSRKGNRLSIRQVNEIFTRRCREAGIGHFTPHSMRHTGARQFINKSENREGALGDLSLLLGHSNPGTTLIYLKHSLPEIAASDGRRY